MTGKWRKSAFAATVLVLLAAAAIWGWSRPKHLFPDICPEDVAAAHVTFGAYPAYRLTENDQRKLVERLQRVKASNTFADYKEYDGIISQMFVLHMKDGSSIGISACPPFFIVDQKGYQCDSAVCRSVSEIYDSYIDQIRTESKPETEIR